MFETNLPYKDASDWSEKTKYANIFSNDVSSILQITL